MDTYEVTVSWCQTARFRTYAAGESEAYLAVLNGGPGVRCLNDVSPDGHVDELLDVSKVGP